MFSEPGLFLGERKIQDFLLIDASELHEIENLKTMEHNNIK